MNLEKTDQCQVFINYEESSDNVKGSLKNTFLKITPRELNFTFSSKKPREQEKIIDITNYFVKSCPIEIVPPVTHYFKIKNPSRRKWLNPGSVFKIIIIFIPDEARNYNDVLKIRYFEDEVLPIKITAKFMTNFSFPTDVDFGNVPLGRAACYKIPIQPCLDKEFSFAILLCKEDPCIDVYPRCGRVRSNQEPLIVMVIYRPLRYISMNFQVQIFISDLCKTPYIINFHGHTRPGLLRETLEFQDEKTKINLRPKKIETISKKRTVLPEIGRAAIHATESLTNIPIKKQDELQQFEHLPLYTLHAVNCILHPKVQSGYSELELRGPLNIYMSHVFQQKLTQQNQFITRAKDYRRENERTKIHHKPKVNYGMRDLSGNKIIEIKMQREQDWIDYKNSMITTLPEELFDRQEVMKLRQRILRFSSKHLDATYKTPERVEAFLRYCKIALFMQAARRIVLKNRLLKILERLKNAILETVPEFNALRIEV